MAEKPLAPTDGYSAVSVAVHLLTAILIVALFFTHSATRGTAGYAFHVSGGAVAGLFLLWRVWCRARRSMAHAPPQAAVLNLAARFVHWGLFLLTAVRRDLGLPAALVAGRCAGRVRRRHSFSDEYQSGAS